MKQKKQVINPQDLPNRFGWSFWIIIYLILDKIESNEIIWWIYGVLLSLWGLLFAYIKINEEHFSVVRFKENVDNWLKL